MTRKRLWKWVLRSVAAVIGLLAAATAWNFATGNFGVVLDRKVYRSAQLRAVDLSRAIEDHGVRTVLNLRGHHPEAAWYREERQATLGHGATQVDIAMSARDWMSREQLRALVDVLENAERPILIHCWRGSERTGLASAVAALLEPGSDESLAESQFSLRYLFVPMGGGVVTRRHLDQYEAWLASTHSVHSPATFRTWATEAFRPGSPGREDWPYDPFPLVVTTRPTPSGPIEQRIEPARRPGSPQPRPQPQPQPRPDQAQVGAAPLEGRKR
jgi:protein tyrosine phosphatase (PTP) superfamily phosphohydrolase (DUF442 family)